MTSTLSVDRFPSEPRGYPISQDEGFTIALLLSALAAGMDPEPWIYRARRRYLVIERLRRASPPQAA